ncbi:DUF4148 domain-containing protein [Roseateles chitinivorans]|uniref:DUF4148 domain-containing protein n=1 Tax=Roseateles chitinivorans TaxID=2917965 RepID=UPI003D664EC6
MTLSTKTLIASALIGLSAAALAVPAFAHGDRTSEIATADLKMPAATKTRAEVLADLQIYRESGLAAVDRTEDTGVEVAERAKAEARYAALKASPRFAELVRRFATKDTKGLALEGVSAR